MLVHHMPSRSEEASVPSGKSVKRGIYFVESTLVLGEPRTGRLGSLLVTNA
jgi:hypothetical protein